MSNFVFIGSGLLLMGGLAACISFYFWQENRDFRLDGVQTRAVLVQKYRKETGGLLGGIENYYVSARFTDASGRQQFVEIRAPSRQWHWLKPGATETILYLPANPARARVISAAGEAVLSAVLLFVTIACSVMVCGGIYFIYVGLTQAPGAATVQVEDPPPSQFAKEGFEPVIMMVSPRHDRVAVLSPDGNRLSVRDLASPGPTANRTGQHWRLLGWSPDGAHLAIDTAASPMPGSSAMVLDSATLETQPGEKYTWNRSAVAVTGCADPGSPVWNPAGNLAAVPCGNDVLLLPSLVRLSGHKDRVVGAAWSPNGHRLASVGEDNYVRIWAAPDWRCIAVSEDYPYPRAAYFSDENTVAVIDVALRRYSMTIR